MSRVVLAKWTVYALPLLCSSWARADPDKPATTELRYDLRYDIPITSVAVLSAFSMEFIFKSSLAPAECRWCDRADDGSDSLNGLDAWARETFKWSEVESSGTLTERTTEIGPPVIIYGLAALVANHDDALHHWPIDALIVTEAAGLAALLHQGVRFVVARQRPSHHFGVDPDGPDDPDANLSFFSGHVSTAAALSVASGTVASMRGYRLAPLVWSVGGVVTLTTGYLRIADDHHYLTDVMVGVAVGGAFGFGIPYFFHGPLIPLNIALRASPGGLSIVGSW